MNEDALQGDPFSPTALDEATELRALSQALQLAEGFKLIFVRCNQSDQRERLVTKLSAELSSLNIQKIHFTELVTHLLDELRKRISSPAPDAVFVSGLEYSMPHAEDAHATPFVANLNASRNSFPDVVPCPLVLWVPEYALNAIAIGAPDFFSIRSGVYFFAVAPGETMDLMQSLMVGQMSTLGSLTLEEKRQRIKAIESLLTDYESLPVDKRDLETEMRLRLRLGHLHVMLGSYDSAKVHFKKLLDQAKRLGKPSFESAAYSGLGIANYHLGNWSEAKAANEKGLEFSRKMGDRLGEALDLRNIGNVHYRLDQSEEARTFYEKSLEIIRELDDKIQVVQAIGNLANVLRLQGNLSEAEKLLNEALQTAREIDDKYTEGGIIQMLGTVYQQEGRLLEAEKTYQQGLQIALELGDYEGAWRTLRNQSLLREQQGDFSGALEFQKKAVEILNMIKAKELSPALSRLADLERKSKQPEEAQNQPA